MRSIAPFLLTATAFAQSGGTITGAITDADGAPVANMSVQATNGGTKAVLKATASAKGSSSGQNSWSFAAVFAERT